MIEAPPLSYPPMGDLHAGLDRTGQTDLAIVGLGSWGMCVLERAVARARRVESNVRVHVIEPGALGGGVYAKDQPDYLVLNNPCGQLSLYASPEAVDEPTYALGLYEWAVQRGYRWDGYECRVGTEGRPIQHTDYLPRRLMGEYLVWFYESLVRNAPRILRWYGTTPPRSTSPRWPVGRPWCWTTAGRCTSTTSS